MAVRRNLAAVVAHGRPAVAVAKGWLAVAQPALEALVGLQSCSDQVEFETLAVVKAQVQRAAAVFASQAATQALLVMLAPEAAAPAVAVAA